MNTEKKLTGWHVFAGFAGAFGIIIVVNFTMAYKSVSTFPGFEVRNSYVASQKFEAERDAMQALGWTSDAQLAADGVSIELRDKSGATVISDTIEAKIGRATHTGDDRDLVLSLKDDRYVADGEFGTGTWTLFLTATAEDGTLYRQRFALVLNEES